MKTFSELRTSLFSKEETEQVLEMDTSRINDDDWYLFHKKTHKPAGSVGASSVSGKRLKMQYKDKPDYDEHRYAVKGSRVKSHLQSLK